MDRRQMQKTDPGKPQMPAFALALLVCGPMACSGQVATDLSRGQAPGPMATAAATTFAASKTAPATAPAPVAYDDSKDGFRLSFPADWKAKASEDFTLLLVPAQDFEAKVKDSVLAGPRISIDVPDLPPHFPGMITLGPMEWHYLSEQKQRFADVKVTEKTDLAIPATSARRLVLAGHAKNADGSAGAAYTLVTMLEIHADRVYLVSAEARTDQYPAVRAAFDQVVASMAWTK
jgi:hypothetical protein